MTLAPPEGTVQLPLELRTGRAGGSQSRGRWRTQLSGEWASGKEQ